MSSDTETNPLSWSETITLIDATALTQAKFDVSMQCSTQKRIATESGLCPGCFLKKL